MGMGKAWKEHKNSENNHVLLKYRTQSVQNTDKKPYYFLIYQFVPIIFHWKLTLALDEDGTALLDSAATSLGEVARTGDTPLLPADCPPEPPAVGLLAEAAAAAALAPGDCRILPDLLVNGGLSGLLAASAFLHLSRWSTILLWVVL